MGEADKKVMEKKIEEAAKAEKKAQRKTGRRRRRFYFTRFFGSEKLPFLNQPILKKQLNIIHPPSFPQRRPLAL